MSTATVVRDLERLSATIEGKDKPIDFFGWSYGTVVGEYLCVQRLSPRARKDDECTYSDD